MKKLKPIKKAWNISSGDYQEPHYLTDIVVYGDTAGKAKVEACAVLNGEGFERMDEEDIVFTNTKVRREKGRDVFLVGGIEKTSCQIEYDNKKKERDLNLDKLVSENPNGMAYIKKRGLYYRPNNCGYTDFVTRAGIYPIKEAASSVKGCGLNDMMQMVVIDTEEHNKSILNQIKDLESRLITTPAVNKT